MSIRSSFARTDQRPRSILFVATEDNYFALHWLALAIKAKHAGFNVSVAARFDRQLQVIEQSGLCAIPFAMNRRGINRGV